MNFPYIAYILVFSVAAGASAASLPLWCAFCRRAGFVDDPGVRKIHARPTPLAGGLAVFTGLCAVLAVGGFAVFAGLPDTQTVARVLHGFERRGAQLAAILAGAGGMLLLGLWDDRRELGAAPKFAVQLVIAAGLAAAGVRITLFIPSSVVGYAITALWLVTVVNAVNFNDNMNGLCAGLAAVAAGWIACFAARHGQYLVAMMALAVLGSLLGFLPFNYPRASAFLGDSGSHLVGYLLAVLAILPHFFSARSPRSNPWAVLTPVLVLAVPLADLVVVSLRRTLAGKPFWIGDTNHFSHRLVHAGFSRPAAVSLLWLAGFVAGALSLFLDRA
jgi:UDP-GlcNAc:undecaprenyl-phosphate/decaprenyl-phosphate GlcNAc-1-phosphate transferase